MRDQLRTLDFEDDETVAIALGAGGAFAFVLGVVAGSASSAWWASARQSPAGASTHARCSPSG